MIERKHWSNWLSIAAAWGMAGVACSSTHDEPEGEATEELGSAELSLTSVPEDLSCLKVTLSGSRSTNKSFDVTPGEPASFVIDRLPLGLVRVEATGFEESCSNVTSSSVPNWVIEKPVVSRIRPLDIAQILLRLIRNGRGEVTVDFEPPPWMSESEEPIDIAIIGDTPYGAAQIEDFPNLLADIDADERISTVVHLGDIKNGSSRCDDSYYAQIFAGISTLTIPFILTPGDNEWTDCHRRSNGAYDPLERLAKLREVFYPVPGLALAGGFKQVLAQSETPGFETYVENQIWFDASVAFGAVHVVGSNDSKVPWYTDDTTGTKVDDPPRRDAERTARNAATIAWLDRLFEIADEHEAAGVAIMMQADMFDAFSVANNLPLDSFSNIVQHIGALSKAYGKPVLLLQGDSHVFIADKPLENGNTVHGVTDAVPNLTRIVVQGSTTTPLTEWLRLHVDPSSPEVFSWERKAR
jgi:hypothetical protein